jgi:histidinol-phosphate aminotransferase
MTRPDAHVSKPPAPLAALQGVTRASESARARSGLIALDRNERLGPLPDWFVDQLRESLDSRLLTTYPALDELYADLAGWTGLDEDRLLLAPGSDAAFRAAYQAYVAPGDRVVMLDPSYAMYSVYAGIFGAEAVRVPIGRSLEVDPGALLDAISADVRLVLLASPNQPTGAALPEELLRAVLARAGEAGALVVVDEAYHPFSRTTVLPWAADEPGLLVTRTFSKAAGLAGLRLGIAAGSPDVIGALAKVRSVFDITSFSAMAARLVISHPEVMDDYVAQVDAGRVILAAQARAAGFEPVDSATNFLVIRTEPRAAPADLIAALRERGWLVRGPFAADCLADCIRVTLGPPELMDEFGAALADAAASLP